MINYKGRTINIEIFIYIFLIIATISIVFYINKPAIRNTQNEENLYKKKVIKIMNDSDFILYVSTVNLRGFLPKNVRMIEVKPDNLVIIDFTKYEK